jgi:hypothetical protein
LPGAQVVFTSDNGVLSQSSAITDATGEARVTLTTSRTTIVTASVAGKEGRATVNVVNNPTVSVSANPANPNVGVPTVFTITPGATTNGNAIANVSFDPGDGSQIKNLGPITSATTTSHAYTRADQYTATAVITDVAGLRGQGTTGVSVGRAIPTATITASPTTASVGESVTFTVSSTPGPNGPPVTRVRVVFPDGQSQEIGGPSGQVTRSFGTPGTYRVTATPIDQSGTEGGAAFVSVIVRERAALEVNVDAADADPGYTTDCQPTGSFYPKTCTMTGFSASPTVRVQLQATVVGASATDPVVRYVWNFGDGSPPETSARSTDHAFAKGSGGIFGGGSASYTVTVTVTTASGQTGTGRVNIVVQ